MKLKRAFFIFTAAVWTAANIGAQSGNGIVISQVYGGGGNSGATLRNDFIELFNRGNTSVTVTGWSVQYASATGTSWDRTLLGGVIQPGQYYLIQEVQGNTGTTSLPTPDLSGGINLSATDGKVALVNNSINLSGAVPSGSQIIDFVGYGSANTSEGSSAAGLTNTTAAIRQSGGCTDTNNNRSDFSVGSPAARNSHSPLNLCGPIPSKADLVVTALAAPTSGTVGGTLAGTSMTVKNQGGSAAGSFRVGFYLSPTAGISASQAYTGTSCSVSSGLPAGNTFNCSSAVVIPPNLSSGTWYLLALADDQGQVDESDENNNQRVSDSGAVTVSGGANAPQPTVTSVTTAGGFPDIAQNDWIEIKGSSLAPSSVGATGITWSNAPEFASGKMPTQLANVSVKVNGKAAYVYYISETQINVLTPLDGSQGQVSIVVANGTASSVPFTANMHAVAPSFLLFGDSKYVVATHANGSLLGPTSLSVPGYSFTPAHPSETIVLYAVGFGLPGTPLVDGSATQSGSLSMLPSIQIGGAPATVLFAGVISPGLYQFNVTLPDNAPNGDNPLTISFGGYVTSVGPLIAVQR